MSGDISTLRTCHCLSFYLISAVLSTVDRRKGAFRSFLVPQQGPNCPFHCPRRVSRGALVLICQGYLTAVFHFLLAERDFPHDITAVMCVKVLVSVTYWSHVTGFYQHLLVGGTGSSEGGWHHGLACSSRVAAGEGHFLKFLKAFRAHVKGVVCWQAQHFSTELRNYAGFEGSCGGKVGSPEEGEVRMHGRRRVCSCAVTLLHASASCLSPASCYKYTVTFEKYQTPDIQTV